ncbi:nucleotidyl transferase AbiEii/AbiGii toxin family protein [Chitinophaga sedimenti]|uniref:nucleotidyl transferase AbiEii/AbiGii toxin family protein n=1 Tax=Chitinophaga sedimenti TaxID=2033606 RepID=UPI0027DF4B99|nr:nucleotidyl transferase AbiEii/AbiGii toxin family protein [Chitinophaga sedimenti]
MEETGAFFGVPDVANDRGLYLFIGENEETAIKTDILYWDAPFLYPVVEEDGVRLAAIEDIAAMKLDAISRGGRKKDFWDLSDILEMFDINELLAIYRRKYPWFEISDVINGLSDFRIADEMPDPICFKKRDGRI